MTTRMYYVMGRGYSGSTFLDVLIGSAPGIESVGEVVSGLNRGPAEICSCGMTAGECPFWIEVAAEYSLRTGSDLYEDGAWLWRRSDVRRFPRAIFARPHSRRSGWAEYQRRQKALIAAVAKVSGAPAVLDSNKEFTRGLLLLKIGAENRVLHLHRSPMAVIGSHYYRRRDKGLPFKFLKKEYAPDASLLPVMMLTALAWSVAMVLGAIVRAMYPRRVLSVRYESLVGSPSDELARIGRFLGADMSDVIAKVDRREPFAVGHNLGGNELRHDGTFTFVPNVRGRRTLPMSYRIATMPFALPGLVLRWLGV